MHLSDCELFFRNNDQMAEILQKMINYAYRGFYPLDSHISIDEIRNDFIDLETAVDENSISWLSYSVRP